MIKILIVNIPPLLSEVLTLAIDNAPDMRLAGRVEGNVLALFAAGWQVDVVIMCDEDVSSLPPLGDHFLTHYPHLHLVVVSPDASQAMLYWLGLNSCHVQQVSTQTLLTNIRRIYTNSSDQLGS